MRVCDRHPDRPARDTITVEGDGSRIDVCAECKTEVLMLLASASEKMNGEAKRRGRPPKHSATAEYPAP